MKRIIFLITISSTLAFTSCEDANKKNITPDDVLNEEVAIIDKKINEVTLTIDNIKSIDELKTVNDRQRIIDSLEIIKFSIQCQYDLDYHYYYKLDGVEYPEIYKQQENYDTYAYFRIDLDRNLSSRIYEFCEAYRPDIVTNERKVNEYIRSWEIMNPDYYENKSYFRTLYINQCKKKGEQPYPID